MNIRRTQFEASMGRQADFSGSGVFHFPFSILHRGASAQGGKIGKRAFILATVDELMQIRRTCGFIIENVFAEDIAARASWKSAAHVENPPKKKKPPEGDGEGDDEPPTP